VSLTECNVKDFLNKEQRREKNERGALNNEKKKKKLKKKDLKRFIWLR